MSLVEMLISLAITAMLLTATMVAIDTSFKAYAAAAETASAQASTRMVVNRVLTLVRTSIAVGPTHHPNGSRIQPDEAITYIEAIGAQGGSMEIRYVEEDETVGGKQFKGRTLYLDQDGADGPLEPVPLLTNVTRCEFHVATALDDVSGVPEVVRATLVLEVAPDDDNTLALEGDNVQPIVVIASTMPRRLN